MSSTLASFGLRPVWHPSGTIRPTMYTPVDATQAAYATKLYMGTPVVLNTDSSINIAAYNAAWLGVFQGCSYLDSTGKPVISNFWPGTTTGATQIKIYVTDDPQIVYEAQCSATVAATAIGDQLTTFDGTYTIGHGSTSTGLSDAAFSGTLAGASSQGNCRIVGVATYPDNAWGDTYPILQVRIANQQFVYPQTAV